MSENWYRLWWSDKPIELSAKDAISNFVSKYGQPPSILLVPPSTKPLEGFNLVIKADPYVPVNTMLVGVIPYEHSAESLLETEEIG